MQHDPGAGFRNFCRATRAFGKIAPVALRWRMGDRNGKALRDAIASAGPMCVKAAQWAIDRGGLLPDDVVEALLPLQDQHEPHPWSATQAVLEAEFPRGTFAWVAQQPLACGSIGQVHRAQLADGRDCVVKVVHAGVRSGLKEDFEALLLVLRMVPSCRNFDMDEVRACVVAQTDLRAEAGNLVAFRANFAGQSRIRFPEPYLIGKDGLALVEAFAPGVPFDAFVAAHPRLAKEAVVARVAVYIKMGWVDNFLHGDMHRGNIMYHEEDGHVCLSIVDAGMVTVVANAAALRRFVEGMFTLQPDNIALLMIELNANPHANVAGFRAHVNAIQDELEYEPSALVRYREIIEQIPMAAAFVAEWERKITASEANGGKAKVIRSCSSNMVKLIRHMVAAVQAYDLIVPGDILLVALTLTVVDGQSDMYIDSNDNVFHDALIYAREIGLIDMVAWLKHDPVPLLVLDRARRHRGEVCDAASTTMQLPDDESSSDGEGEEQQREGEQREQREQQKEGEQQRDGEQKEQREQKKK